MKGTTSLVQGGLPKTLSETSISEVYYDKVQRSNKYISCSEWCQALQGQPICQPCAFLGGTMEKQRIWLDTNVAKCSSGSTNRAKTPPNSLCFSVYLSQVSQTQQGKVLKRKLENRAYTWAR